MKIEDSLSVIKGKIRELNATGSDGFEGLLAVLLSNISGFPFRLAGAGSQHGKDGEGYSETSYICFEAKLYTSKLSGKEVLYKATEIIGGIEVPDIWIMGATVEVKSQILNPLKTAFERNGISLLVLDWPSAVRIPPLACLLGLAPTETLSFLEKHGQDPTNIAHMEAALKVLCADEQFAQASSTIIQKISDPTVGLPQLTFRNREWIKDIFSDRRKAKLALDQQLAPLDKTQVELIDRPEQRQLRKAVVECNNHSLIVIAGNEGSGKSWLFASMWCSEPSPPLTVVVPAADLSSSLNLLKLDEWLIEKITLQSDSQASPFVSKKWTLFLKHWAIQAKPALPNIVLFIDGLNQNPEQSWSRLIDGITNFLEKIGGILIVSVRKKYFDEFLKDALLSETKVIEVPEWNEAQLVELLKRKGIDETKVSNATFNTLRNPRILSIAFELLDNAQIEGFEELSVDRLLFEHIRHSSKLSTSVEAPTLFKSRLASHADEVLSRVRKRQTQDQFIFQTVFNDPSKAFQLDQQLLAVTEGRFFQSLPEDATLYKVSDEGLVLALGLSLIKSLQKSERNKRNLIDELNIIIEPIAALDKTSETVLSALIVASIKGECSPTITQTLLQNFLHLQNIDSEKFYIFTSIVRQSVTAAMNVLFDINKSEGRAANKSWLLQALSRIHTSDQCWEDMASQIDRWLRYYSLDPSLSVSVSKKHEGVKKYDQEVKKKSAKISQTIASMPPAEVEFLNGYMIENTDLDISQLGPDLLYLLSGKPLCQFSKALVACCYSRSLNSSYPYPYDEFLSVIRHNKSDWAETRTALLENAHFLLSDDATVTARWAMVTILRSTSTIEDAELENTLVGELTRDRDIPGPWRLIEEYCPTDPCDPTSSYPKRIEETAKKYDEINVRQVRQSAGTSSETHLLLDALPGMARFQGEIAWKVHQKFAKDVIRRDLLGLEYGLYALESSSVVLEEEDVDQLLQKTFTLCVPDRQASTEAKDQWLASQYGLLITFPHLDGDRQLEALRKLPYHQSPLLKLSQVFKTSSPDYLAQILVDAVNKDDANFQAMILFFARYSGTTITPVVRKVLRKLFHSTDSSVRGTTLDLIYHLKDRDLVKLIADSAWCTQSCDPHKNSYEIWYGSQVIILAAKIGLINGRKAVRRISTRLYSMASKQLDSEAIAEIATCLDQSIHHVLAIDLSMPPFVIEENKPFVASTHPTHFSLLDSEHRTTSNLGDLRHSETKEEFEQRQHKLQEKFEVFEKVLSENEALLVIEDVGYDAICRIAELHPGFITRWIELCLSQSRETLSRVHHIALMLARVVSQKETETAIALFDKAAECTSLVRRTHGIAHIPLEATCLWSNAEVPDLKRHCVARIDSARSDSELAIEVFAALESKQDALLDQYILDQIAKPRPVDVARGLMVCGFSLPSSLHDDILSRFVNAQGFIGKAAKAAKFAYERNIWAEHWFSEMSTTNDRKVFWRCSRLFLRIVDHRYELWNINWEDMCGPMKDFSASLGSDIESRYRQWRDKRSKTLFGSKSPPTMLEAL